MVWRCTSAPSCVAKAPPPVVWNDPEGIAADAGSNVYIANTESSQIVKLPPSGNAVLRTFPDPGYYPVDVAVATNGAVCATNLEGTAGGQGNIVCYKYNGSPTWTICCVMYQYFFLGFDGAGNLYADGRDSNSNTLVEKIASASTGGTTETPIGITNVSFPGGIEIARSSGHLLISDQNCPCIRRYMLPTYFPLSSVTLAGVGDPVSFGVQQGGGILWAADAANATADAYIYPAGSVKYFLYGSTEFPPSGLTVPVGEVYTPYGQY